MPTASPSPFGGRNDESVQGHWLLARLGKRVLCGLAASNSPAPCSAGQESATLTLSNWRPAWAEPQPRSSPSSRAPTEPSTEDPEAVHATQPIVAEFGDVRTADAAETGLLDASADVVIGEAMLTMQGNKAKTAIITEAVRLLRPGGCYAIHELGLTPDYLAEQVKTDVCQALARSIKVNARPLTLAEWQQLLTEHGLVVDRVETAPMALLQPRRLIADEGLRGAMRFAGRLATHASARSRVLAMRKTFRTYRANLTAVAIISHKPDTAT